MALDLGWLSRGIKQAGSADAILLDSASACEVAHLSDVVAAEPLTRSPGVPPPRAKRRRLATPTLEGTAPPLPASRPSLAPGCRLEAPRRRPGPGRAASDDSDDVPISHLAADDDAPISALADDDAPICRLATCGAAPRSSCSDDDDDDVPLSHLGAAATRPPPPIGCPDACGTDVVARSANVAPRGAASSPFRSHWVLAAAAARGRARARAGLGDGGSAGSAERREALLAVVRDALGALRARAWSGGIDGAGAAGGGKAAAAAAAAAGPAEAPRPAAASAAASTDADSSLRSLAVALPSAVAARTAAAPEQQAPADAADAVSRGQKTCRHRLHGFTQVSTCDPGRVDAARRLFHRYGWPRPTDKASRLYISEMLGRRRRRHRGKGRMTVKRTTYLAWAALDKPGSPMVAAAILSVYLYRDARRRCGCLEFIVSKSRGAGGQLVGLARDILLDLGVPRLFSGADLSRPLALKAHVSWGFRAVEQDEWLRAGLLMYGQGAVLYTVLDLLPLRVAAAAPQADEDTAAPENVQAPPEPPLDRVVIDIDDDEVAPDGNGGSCDGNGMTVIDLEVARPTVHIGDSVCVGSACSSGVCCGMAAMEELEISGRHAFGSSVEVVEDDGFADQTGSVGFVDGGALEEGLVDARQACGGGSSGLS